ncbi:MAG: HlyD family efflux transporter periplasmic adaptor subunit [Rhodospirillaceae bacterium]|nr:HlyD family efflux transporter periplasmic adaptor subunit [Rhodospirillales bacterium]
MAVAPGGSPLLTLLQLEHEARFAQSLEGLRFVIANRTRMLLPYRQAMVLAWSKDHAASVTAVSDVPAPDANAPQLRWVTACARHLSVHEDSRRAHRVERDAVTERERAEWAEWSAAHVLWVPLIKPDGQPVGVLWLSRAEPFADEELVLAERLAETYAHAWAALIGPVRALPAWVKSRKLWAWSVVALLVLLLLPVRQSALAPGEVIADEPFVVAAPLDGVIARFFVRPNETVTEGQKLLAFDDTDLTARAQVAAEDLAVTQAELRKAEQGAMSDPQSAAQVALARAQVDLKTAELNHASSLLARSAVKAERAGVAVFRNVNDWIGKPVRTGERIVTLADPARVMIEAHLPVADALVLAEGNAMVMFLDADPLRPVSARLAEASYEAAMSDEGILAYRVRGQLEPGETAPRIGLRGTIRIDGPRVPLFLYLFRRPIAALRHMLGL